MDESYSKPQAKAADAVLAQRYDEMYAAQDRLDAARRDASYTSGARPVGRGHWSLSWNESIERLRAAVDGDNPRKSREATIALDRFDLAESTRTQAQKRVDTQEGLWLKHGRWSRFFVVPDGHIHRSTGCSSLRPTTRIGWLPELSGETEAEAVKGFGSVLCTKCFPSAPVEWTSKHPKPADPNDCQGTKVVSDTYRMTSRNGSGRGVCATCEQWVQVTSTGKLRKHSKPTVQS